MKENENHEHTVGASIDANLRVKERKYWLNKLSGELVKTGFPFDPGEPVEDEPQFKTANFVFSDEIFSRLARLSNDSDLRLYIILTTCLILLLEKYSGSRDILIGAPIYKQEIEGEFINKILVLRNLLKDDMTFKELLLQVSRTNLEAVENVNYPLETVPYELNMTFPENEFPLFDVAVLLENIHDESYLSNLNLNVVFSFLKTENTVAVTVRYRASNYRDETVERIIRHLDNLMNQALFGIDNKIADISVMSEEELKQLLVDINETAAQYPRKKTIHRLFREQAGKTPDNIALQYGDRHLTYEQLEEKSNRFAGILRSKGVGTGTIAALLLERSPELVFSILAILKAGGTYLPIDLEYPSARINYFLADSGSRHILTGENPPDDIEFTGTVIRPVDPGHYRDSDQQNNGDDFSYPGAGTGIAYVIYTSGTTDKPKGVMIPN
ncbi:MAG: AMP-binding protein, partial [bacterium]|nr:AMP-binding protein [bacterium]